MNQLLSISYELQVRVHYIDSQLLEQVRIVNYIFTVLQIAFWAFLDRTLSPKVQIIIQTYMLHIHIYTHIHIDT